MNSTSSPPPDYLKEPSSGDGASTSGTSVQGKCSGDVPRKKSFHCEAHVNQDPADDGPVDLSISSSKAAAPESQVNETGKTPENPREFRTTITKLIAFQLDLDTSRGDELAPVASGNQFQCHICKAGFRLRVNLEQHQIFRHHKCCETNCTAVFSTREELREHQGQCNANQAPVFKCPPPPSEILVTNLRRTYGSETPTTKLSSEDTAKRRPNRNKCSVGGCAFLAPKLSQLRSHQLTVHGKEVDVFQCSFCRKHFVTRFTLKNHQRTHNAKNRTPKRLPNRISSLRLRRHKKCSVPDCPFLAKSLGELREHKISAHGGNRVGVFMCGQCNRAFPGRRQLLRHQRNDHQS